MSEQPHKQSASSAIRVVLRESCLEIGSASGALVGNFPTVEQTMHERRILKLLVEGSSFQVTAQVLGVSINTVSFHVRRIYEKLEVHSKSEAVAKAIRNNLV